MPVEVEVRSENSLREPLLRLHLRIRRTQNNEVQRALKNTEGVSITRRGRFLRSLLPLFLLPVILLQLMAPSLALAADGTPPHEDPATAPSRFDGASILGFCTDLLDAVLARQPETVASLAEKALFANTPDGVRSSLVEFSGANIQLGLMVPQVETDLNDMDEMAKQNRFQEIGIQVPKTQSTLNMAFQELTKLESDNLVFRKQLGADSALAGSPLANAFAEMQNRIGSVRSLLNMFQALLDGMGAVSNPNNLHLTELTFALKADSAFVGDAVRFNGILTAQGNGLAGRTVRILVDGLPYLTARTAADGSYSGNLQIPYKYVRTISIRALYYPQDSDVGVYLASRSPETLFGVLFYSVILSLDTPVKSYPGQESTINAHFDYGEYPVPASREASVYFDGGLLMTVMTGADSTIKFNIDSKESSGPHLLEVKAPARQRYAPVEAKAILNVLRAKTTLDVLRAKTILDVRRPGITFQPFSMRVQGSARSELGPLIGATVEAEYGNGKVAGTTGQDGTFSLSVPNNLTFSLIGTQRLSVKVTSAEPWNDNVTQAWTLVSVNPVMIILLCALLALFIVVIKVRRVVLPGRHVTPQGEERSVLPNLGSPEAGTGALTGPASVSLLRAPGDGTPTWLLYAGVLELIERRTGQVMADNQTFREFGNMVDSGIGLASAHLDQLNRLMEKMYYSGKPLDSADIEKCRTSSRLFAEAMP